MLSRDERRRLAAIELALSLEDPKLAEAMRSGRLRPLRDRAWWRRLSLGPLLLGLVVTLGLLTGAALL